ncbi:hypothetical protein ABH979_005541 [Bradyrhizobium ottawaense]
MPLCRFPYCNIAQWTAGASRLPAFPAPSFNYEGEEMKQSSGELRREDDEPCLSLNKGLVPRTQRSASSAVRCRAGAHVAARVVALWVPALRSNAYALQRVRDTREFASQIPRQFGLDLPVDGVLDLAARDPDVAQGAVVEFVQCLHRRAALEAVEQRIGALGERCKKIRPLRMGVNSARQFARSWSCFFSGLLSRAAKQVPLAPTPSASAPHLPSDCSRSPRLNRGT